MPVAPGTPGAPGGQPGATNPGATARTYGYGAETISMAAYGAGVALSDIPKGAGVPFEMEATKGTRRVSASSRAATRFKRLQSLTPDELNRLASGTRLRTFPGAQVPVEVRVPVGAKAVQEMGEDAAQKAANKLASRAVTKNVLKMTGKATMGVADIFFAHAEAQENISKGMNAKKAYARESLGAVSSLGAGAAGMAKGAAMGAAIGGPFAPVTAVLGALALGGFAAFAAEKATESAFDAVAGNEVKDRERKEKERAAMQVQKQAPQRMANSYMQAMHGQQQRQPTEMAATIPLQNVININGVEVHNKVDDLKQQLDVTTGRKAPTPRPMNLPAVSTQSTGR